MATSGEQEDRLLFGKWEKPDVTGKTPSGRFGHSSVVVGDAMFTFGGSSYAEDESTEMYSDLHLLRLGERLSWEEVEQKGDIPSPREGAILVAISDRLYLYGGQDKENTKMCTEGLFEFNTVTCEWNRRETSGPAPRALSMSGVVCGEKLVTFGGIIDGKANNTTHILDIDNLEWTELKTHGTVPKSRCDHSCSVLGRGVCVCVGAGSDDLWFSDLHQLNLDSYEWREVEGKGQPPSPRDYSSLVSVGDRYLVMFGGSCAMGSSEEYFSDLHWINLTSDRPEWQKVKKEEGGVAPQPRYTHTMVTWGNKLYIFGGQNNDSVFNDLWTISFSLTLSRFQPVPVPSHSYNTSVPIPAPRRKVTPPNPKTVKPRDFEELRSSYIKRINEMFDLLGDQFNQLDNAFEGLASERKAFSQEKAAHEELYEQQQAELQAMFQRHRAQNEEWWGERVTENNTERKAIAKEKAELESARTELAREKEVFADKSRKLDAIMKQVQGLQEP